MKTARRNNSDPKRFFSSLCAEERKLVSMRRMLLAGWEKARMASGRADMGDVTSRYIERQRRAGVEVCRSSLFKWAKRYRARGLARLLDVRRTPLRRVYPS